LIAPIYSADPQMGSRFLIKIFAVVIIGGMGSYSGAIAGALLLGVVEVLGGYRFGQVAGSAVVYLVMIGVLLVRPRGLFGFGVRGMKFWLCVALAAVGAAAVAWLGNRMR
jgi:branched-chain amino acid transport system permease protein